VLSGTVPIMKLKLWVYVLLRLAEWLVIIPVILFLFEIRSAEAMMTISNGKGIEQPKTYTVSTTPLSFATSGIQSINEDKDVVEARMISGILSIADDISDVFGSYPPYDGTQFDKGEFLSLADAIYVSPYILACESHNKSVGCIIDTNGKKSCGPAQFQGWKTFWEPMSGVYGDPNDKTIAVKGLLWGLTNGYIQKWSCAKILKIIPRNG